MGADHIMAPLTAHIRHAPDADDASLDVGRHLCCTLRVTPGNYDSIVVICDRGEYEALLHEFTPGSPALTCWISERSCLIVEA